MNIHTTELPQLVTFSPDGEVVCYGVLTKISTGATTRTASSSSDDGQEAIFFVTRVQDKIEFKVPAKYIDFFSQNDYARLRNDFAKNSWLKGILVRTNDGRTGTVDDIRLISPYPKPNAFIRFPNERSASVMWLDDIKSFIGHKDVPA